MIVVMDMSSGKRVDEQDFGEYAAEVLNANWLALPQVAPQVRAAVEPDAGKPARRMPPLDVDEFLRIIYLSQE